MFLDMTDLVTKLSQDVTNVTDHVTPPLSIKRVRVRVRVRG